MKKQIIITIILILTTLFSSVSVGALANEGTTLMYDVNGNVAYVPNSQTLTHNANGWYYVPVTKMYSSKGEESIIPISAVETYKNLGWSEETKTMYSLDGYSANVPLSQIKSHLELGWILEPVIPMYDINGNMAYVPDSQTQAHNKLGWYYAPVMKMYSPDGRSTVIAQSDFYTYKGWGWYEYPVTTVYDSSCMGKVIATSELATWQRKGWYQTNWRKAYADILYNYCNMKHDERKWKDNDWYYSDFNLVYIDGDNIPELLVRVSSDYGSRGVEIYTYKNGQVYTDYTEYGDISRFGIGWEVSYIPKSGLIVSKERSGSGRSWGIEVYKLLPGEFSHILSAWTSVYSDYDVNGVPVNEYTFSNTYEKYTSRAVDGFGSYYYSLTPSNIKAATWY
ncbi:MAG: hypothetical protein J6B23_03105 [Clostridia bacterium]|nr:hypothetical protein [Clostridia bacterium]